MLVESDFDKIFSRTVQPSYSFLKKLWTKNSTIWVEHLLGLSEFGGYQGYIFSSFDQLSAEEQFAFWAWTRETKVSLK